MLLNLACNLPYCDCRFQYHSLFAQNACFIILDEEVSNLRKGTKRLWRSSTRLIWSRLSGLITCEIASFRCQDSKFLSSWPTQIFTTTSTNILLKLQNITISIIKLLLETFDCAPRSWTWSPIISSVYPNPLSYPSW